MAQLPWKPVWAVPAAMRAVRATVVIPSLFALTYKVVADPQMALFATFGGFVSARGGVRNVMCRGCRPELLRRTQRSHNTGHGQ